MTDCYQFVPATPDQVETIRKQLGTSEEDIRRAVASLRDWLSKQPHLPDQIDDAHIERMYIHCKCSIERVKKGLDAYFSMRTRYPEILMNRDPMGPDVVHTMKHMKLAIMPRLTKDLHRVIVVGGIDPDPTWVSWPKHGKTISIGIEMLYFDDYSLGDIAIYDMTHLNAGHIFRTDINCVRALEIGHKTAYCRRLKAFHIINADKIIDFVMKLLKSALSEKLQSRVHIHLQGSTTLFDHVPKEYVPDELGGTAGPFDKFAYSTPNFQLLETLNTTLSADDFIRRAEEKREWFLEQDKYTSDESKRPADSYYGDDMYGVAGSFKKLTVD